MVIMEEKRNFNIDLNKLGHVVEKNISKKKGNSYKTLLPPPKNSI